MSLGWVPPRGQGVSSDGGVRCKELGRSRNPRALHPVKPGRRPGQTGGGDIKPPASPRRDEASVGYPEAHGGRPGRDRRAALAGCGVPSSSGGGPGPVCDRTSRRPPRPGSSDVARPTRRVRRSPRSKPSGRARRSLARGDRSGPVGIEAQTRVGDLSSRRAFPPPTTGKRETRRARGGDPRARSGDRPSRGERNGRRGPAAEGS